MKKPALATTFILVLMLSVTGGTYLVQMGKANPYAWLDSDTIRAGDLAYPSIAVLSPAKNNTLLRSNNLTIAFTASIDFGWEDVPNKGGLDQSTGTFWSGSWIEAVYYKPSWQSNEVNMSLPYAYYWNISETLDLTGIPEGNQSVTITAYGHGCYPGIVNLPLIYPDEPRTNQVCYYFDSMNRYVLGFTVDTLPPQVSVLDLDKKTFIESEIALSFTANETVSKITYSLDKQENVTINGNTTITELADGMHSLTVYVMDEAGNTGFQTVYFSVALFPAALVLASVFTVVAVSIGLFVYFKKRQRNKNP